MKLLTVIACFIAVVFVLVAMPLTLWYFGRLVNYKLQYRAMVQDEIRQMVKPDALRQ